MEMKHKTAKIVVAGIAIVFVLVVGISLATSSGLVNLLLRNALAFDKNIPDPGWSGTNYERIPYADISETDYLDLYVPDSAEPRPLFILVNCGGFLGGDSQSRQSILMYQYIRSLGYACASVNYRLAGEATYPAAVDDVKAAVRFLRANADVYGYDPDRFVIWGESAGGYLASMAALSGEDEYHGVKFIGEDEVDPVSGKVSALIDFYGVLDFAEIDNDFEELKIPSWLRTLVSTNNIMNRDDSFVAQFLGETLNTFSQNELNETSPTFRVTSGLENQNIKVFVTHGSVDITVPKLQSVRLYNVCTAALGAENVTYIEQQNLKHADDRFYSPENLEPVKEFLESLW